MANKKISELTAVVTLPDAALITAVDLTRAAGDQNVKIAKSDLVTGGVEGDRATITNVIPITNIAGSNYNFNTANPETAYTVTRNSVINQWCQVFINSATEPTLTLGGVTITEVGGSGWVANTDLYLYLRDLGVDGIHYAFLPKAVGSGGFNLFVDDGITSVGNVDNISFGEGFSVTDAGGNQVDVQYNKIITAVKTADETIANSNVVVLDSELQFNLEANSYYLISLNCLYKADADADFRTQFQIPTSADGLFTRINHTSTVGSQPLETVQNNAGAGIVVRRMSVYHITIYTLDAGVFGVKWAQNTANAIGTIFEKGSGMVLNKLN